MPPRCLTRMCCLLHRRPRTPCLATIQRRSAHPPWLLLQAQSFRCRPRAAQVAARLVTRWWRGASLGRPCSGGVRSGRTPRPVTLALPRLVCTRQVAVVRHATSIFATSVPALRQSGDGCSSSGVCRQCKALQSGFRNLKHCRGCLHGAHCIRECSVADKGTPYICMCLCQCIAIAVLMGMSISVYTLGYIAIPVHA